MQYEHRCFAEIDLDAIDNNLRMIKKTSQVMSIVKADAYGHGFNKVCASLEQAGTDYFGVSNLKEAIELRLSGIKTPILILGYTDPANVILLAEHNITQTVYSAVFAKDLNEMAQKNGVIIQAHIKLDTGMGRIGFCVENNQAEVLEEISAIYRYPFLDTVGLFTHLASADSTDENAVLYTKKQFYLFENMISMLKEKNISFKYIHCLNSAGILCYNECSYNIVRAGIILYGCSPSQEISCNMTPALQLKASISLVKKLKKGMSISYGCIFTAPHDMVVATVSAGYADGYPRALSNKGITSVGGKTAPVVGRVCMDQLIIDVTGIDGVKQGDIVTLYGHSPADTVTDVAQKADTINYEILCRITRRVPRIYTRGGIESAITDYQNI